MPKNVLGPWFWSRPRGLGAWRTTAACFCDLDTQAPPRTCNRAVNLYPVTHLAQSWPAVAAPEGHSLGPGLYTCMRSCIDLVPLIAANNPGKIRS